MDQLIQQNLRSIDRIVRKQARTWHLRECDLEDITQETLLRTFKGWKPSRKDPKVHFLSLVHLNAHTTVMRLMGYHNGYKRPQQVKAAGEQATDQVGLYQPTYGEPMLLDERILPTVASAEDVYMAKLPTRRQVALREAIDGLPEPQRTAMREQVYEELSVAESASSMGISNVQVSLLRSSGTAMLKRRLSPNG